MTNRMNNKMIMAIKTLVAVAIPAVVFSTGAIIGQATSELQITKYTNTNSNTGFNPTVEARLIETHRPIC